MVYAQNDELWSTMRYESGSPKKFRNFGQGGCGPTAVAMAVANLVEKDELTKLVGYAGEDVGFTFCTCSVNRLLCNQKHVQYRLRTADEMLRYLPVAMAGFASGNNIWNLKSRKTTVQGTDMRFLDYVGMIYGLSITKTRRLSEAVDMLREGGCMVVSCTTVGGPFTKTGITWCSRAWTTNIFMCSTPTGARAMKRWTGMALSKFCRPAWCAFRWSGRASAIFRPCTY